MQNCFCYSIQNNPRQGNGACQRRLCVYRRKDFSFSTYKDECVVKVTHIQVCDVSGAISVPCHITTYTNYPTWINRFLFCSTLASFGLQRSARSGALTTVFTSGSVRPHHCVILLLAYIIESGRWGNVGLYSDAGIECNMRMSSASSLKSNKS